MPADVVLAGSKRVHPSLSAGGRGIDDGELEVEQSKPADHNLARTSARSAGSRRCSADGKDNDQANNRMSEVSTYTDKTSEEAVMGKKKRWMCLLLPLVLLLAASGLFVGLYLTKQLQPKAGTGPLTFQVTVAAPAKAAQESCTTWFGSSEVRTIKVCHAGFLVEVCVGALPAHGLSKLCL